MENKKDENKLEINLYKENRNEGHAEKRASEHVQDRRQSKQTLSAAHMASKEWKQLYAMIGQAMGERN